MRAPPSLTVAGIHELPPAVGLVDVNIWPKPPATHSELLGQASDHAFTLRATCFHAGAPSLGWADTYTPNRPIATHKDVLGQARAVKLDLVRGIREMCQEARPLAGSVAVIRLLALSMATHRVVFGQAMLRISPVPKVKGRQSRRPPSGWVEMNTWPLAAVTHRRADGQANGKNAAPESRVMYFQSGAPLARLVDMATPPRPLVTQKAVLGQRIIPTNALVRAVRGIVLHFPAAGSAEVAMPWPKVAKQRVAAGQVSAPIGSDPST